MSTPRERVLSRLAARRAAERIEKEDALTSLRRRLHALVGDVPDSDFVALVENESEKAGVSVKDLLAADAVLRRRWERIAAVSEARGVGKKGQRMSTSGFFRRNPEVYEAHRREVATGSPVDGRAVVEGLFKSELEPIVGLLAADGLSSGEAELFAYREVPGLYAARREALNNAYRHADVEKLVGGHDARVRLLRGLADAAREVIRKSASGVSRQAVIVGLLKNLADVHPAYPSSTTLDGRDSNVDYGPPQGTTVGGAAGIGDFDQLVWFLAQRFVDDDAEAIIARASARTGATREQILAGRSLEDLTALLALARRGYEQR